MYSDTQSDYYYYAHYEGDITIWLGKPEVEIAQITKISASLVLNLLRGPRGEEIKCVNFYRATSDSVRTHTRKLRAMYNIGANSDRELFVLHDPEGD